MAHITLAKRKRLTITTARTPGAGGSDEPNNPRIYMVPNATQPATTALKLQHTGPSVTLITYNAAGAAPPTSNGFVTVAGVATIQSALGEWSLTGDGLFNLQGFRGRGSTFPGSPSGGDLFMRDDLGMWFRYDGSDWLCTCLHTQILRNTSSAGDHNYSATTGTMAQAGPVPSQQGGTDIYIVRHMADFIVTVGSALGASHKWVGTFSKQDSSGSLSTVATATIDSGTSGVWRKVETVVDASIAGTFFRWGTQWTKTGTPGDLAVHEEVTYRIVAT